MAVLVLHLAGAPAAQAPVMPLAAQEGAVAGQEWAAANMARIGANLQDRLRTEGFIK